MSADLQPSTATGSRPSVRAARAAAMRSEAAHNSPYVIVDPSDARWAGASGCARTCRSTAHTNSFSLVMVILPPFYPIERG